MIESHDIRCFLNLRTFQVIFSSTKMDDHGFFGVDDIAFSAGICFCYNALVFFFIGNVNVVEILNKGNVQSV